MWMIMWLYQGKYDKLIPLMGGFHMLLVFLKIMHKKYGCLGLDQWWVAGGAIKEKSVPKAIEGKHYYQGIGHTLGYWSCSFPLSGKKCHF